MKIPVLSLPARVTTLALASLLSVLAACGGGGGGDERQGTSDNRVPTPTAPGNGGGSTPAAPTPASTGVAVSGTVTGFGSVIIDGVRYDDSLAVVGIDNGDAAAKAGALGDVKLGMSVDARVVAGQLKDVTVRAALAGPIGGIDPETSSFTIYGQTVKVLGSGASPTVFEGVSGFDGLALADRVEVHGTVDAQRVLQATRVERKPRETGDPAVRLGGMVSRLDTVGKTFRLHDLTVYYSDATVSPSGATLTDGQLVVVFGDTAPAASRFTAKTVRVKAAEEGSAVALGGRVTGFVTLADFKVSGVRVDASAATLEGGTAADVQDGASVGVEGTVTGGVVNASKLRVIKTAGDALSSLKGEVSGFLSLSSFTLRGMTVDASEARFTGGVAADVGNGAKLAARGHVEGNVFKAEDIEFLAPATAPTKPASNAPHWAAGRAYDAVTYRFKLPNVGINYTAQTTIEGGTAADITNGVMVYAKGSFDPATRSINATWIEVVKADQRGPRATGPVSDYVSLANFRVGGQRVDATAATLVDGQAADLANGVPVMVTGSLVERDGERVLVAAKLRFMQ